MRSYTEMKTLTGYHERLEYLKLLDNKTDSPRAISQEFFQSSFWKAIRKQVIERDGRYDLGVDNMYIEGSVYVHHINPINEDDIRNMSPKVTDLDNLVCASLDTHNAIHYKDRKETYVERRPGDTKLW